MQQPSKNPPGHHPAEGPPFRERVLKMLVDALGEPQVMPVVGGEIYRWTLPRLYGVNFYITLDSPEHPQFAHVMLSDGPKYQAKPVESFLLDRIDQAEQLVERIIAQWKKPRDR